MKYAEPEPGAKEAIDTAKANDSVVVMMVDWYQTDEEAIVLRDLLWYARDTGVAITFAFARQDTPAANTEDIWK